MHLTTWQDSTPRTSCELGSWASCTGQPTGPTGQLDELRSWELGAGQLEVHISCNVGAGQLEP